MTVRPCAELRGSNSILRLQGLRSYRRASQAMQCSRLLVNAADQSFRAKPPCWKRNALLGCRVYPAQLQCTVLLQTCNSNRPVRPLVAIFLTACKGLGASKGPCTGGIQYGVHHGHVPERGDAADASQWAAAPSTADRSSGLQSRVDSNEHYCVLPCS